MSDDPKETGPPHETPDSLQMPPEMMLELAHKTAELIVERIDGLSDESAFAVKHDVLQDTIWGANHPNFSDRGLQLSRSVRALKVWVSIQTFGMVAFRSAVARGMELAARAESYVQGSPNLEILNPASLGIVCFRVNPADTDLDEDALDRINRTVLSQVFWDERTFISSTFLHGTFALRLCILNHTTTWNDVRETLDAVEQFGKEALAGVA